jgi:hypothetical protein
MRRPIILGNHPWWMDPANFVIFVTLPVFVISAVLGGPLMTEQFESFNFLTTRVICLGALSICLLAVGAKVGSVIASRSVDRGTRFHPSRFDQFLVLLLVIALASHLLLLGSVLLDPSLAISVLRGDKGAMFAARGNIERLFGITSLTNVSPVFWAMCSIRYVTRGAFFPSRQTALLTLLLPPLIFIHAFVGSERIVVIENGLAFMLPLFSFAPRFRRMAVYAPFAGLAAVLIIFTVGEYMRQWAIYQDRYDSFAQFAGLRLLAYLAVASNTGAGMIATMPPVGHPLITAVWFAKLPLVHVSDVKRQYLVEYGNREFNNPSGIFAPVVDFGWTVGILYLFIWGLVLGTLYGFYRRGHPVGLLLFPFCYIGLADLTQIWYWGQPPFVWQFMFLLAAIAATVRRPVLTAIPSRY